MAEEVLLSGQSTASAPPLSWRSNIRSVVRRAADFGYLSLRQRWLLLLATALVGGLLAGAGWLPQLPGQLRSDPTASARWLLETSNSYGMIGGLLRALGLFDALHSSLLQLALAVLALILAIHLSDCLVSSWSFYRLPLRLTASPAASGVPVEAGMPLITYRHRQAVATPPDQLPAQVRTLVSKRFPRLLEAQLALSPLPATGEDELDDTDSGAEWRLLATKDASWLYLRPLGLLGALLALAALWWMVIVGWNVIPPLLAPGDIYRYAQQNLELHYLTPTTTTRPELQAKREPLSAQKSIEQRTNLWLGAVGIHAQPGPPALLVRVSQGEASLGRAGQTKVANFLGLVFPSIGNEEFIVLRQQEVGLRIVRTATVTATGDLAGFLVELYRGQDTKPTPVTLDKTQRQLIPINQQVTLELTALPSLEVSARYWPGRWLFWLALVLGAVGCAGFLRRPAYLLVQIGPWPDLRSVVVVQSNQPAALAGLQSFLNTNEPSQ